MTTPGSPTRVLAQGLGFPEAPVLLSDGSLVVTELARARGRVTRIDRDGGRLEPIAVTGRPNGLAVDRDGVLWVAESLTPAVLRLRLDGNSEVWTEDCAGEPLLWPNDLCFGPDGALYLTDSGVLVERLMDGDELRPGWESIELDGRVLRFDRETRSGEIIDRGLQFANGIAFGPDGQLYANEELTGNVYRYRRSRDGWVRDQFGNVLDPSWTGTGLRGPDGMAFDRGGNLYVAVFGQGDITVLARDGAVLRRHELRGTGPTNCAFGPAGSGELYVVETEQGAVEVVDVSTDGQALWG